MAGPAVPSHCRLRQESAGSSAPCRRDHNPQQQQRQRHQQQEPLPAQPAQAQAGACASCAAGLGASPRLMQELLRDFQRTTEQLVQDKLQEQRVRTHKRLSNFLGCATLQPLTCEQWLPCSSGHQHQGQGPGGYTCFKVAVSHRCLCPCRPPWRLRPSGTWRRSAGSARGSCRELGPCARWHRPSTLPLGLSL